jgi:hypothetical protein
MVFFKITSRRYCEKHGFSSKQRPPIGTSQHTEERIDCRAVVLLNKCPGFYYTGGTVGFCFTRLICFENELYMFCSVCTKEIGFRYRVQSPSYNMEI